MCFSPKSHKRIQTILIDTKIQLCSPFYEFNLFKSNHVKNFCNLSSAHQWCHEYPVHDDIKTLFTPQYITIIFCFRGFVFIYL